MDPILLRTQLWFCHKYKIKLTLNSKNVKQLITTAIISIEMFLSRECGWLIYTQKKTTKNGFHPGPYFTHLFGLELYLSPFFSSLTKQPTFWDATTGFPAKWCWGMSIKCPFWWPITTQIRVVLLIGWKFTSSIQKQYPDLQGCH